MQAQPLAYATAAERMLKAIGEPEDHRHAQRPAPVAHLRQQGDQGLPAFAEFYGMEDSIEQVVSYFRHAAQGWKKKQILYLLGPVGGGRARSPSGSSS